MRACSSRSILTRRADFSRQRRRSPREGVAPIVQASGSIGESGESHDEFALEVGRGRIADDLVPSGDGAGPRPGGNRAIKIVEPNRLQQATGPGRELLGGNAPARREVRAIGSDREGFRRAARRTFAFRPRQAFGDGSTSRSGSAAPRLDVEIEQETRDRPNRAWPNRPRRSTAVSGPSARRFRSLLSSRFRRCAQPSPRRAQRGRADRPSNAPPRPSERLVRAGLVASHAADRSQRNMVGDQVGHERRRSKRFEKRFVERSEVNMRPLSSQRPAIVSPLSGSAAEKL